MTTRCDMVLLAHRLEACGYSAAEVAQLCGGAVSENTVRRCISPEPNYRCHNHTKRVLEMALDSIGK